MFVCALDWRSWKIEVLARANDALANVDLGAVSDVKLGEMIVAVQREQARLVANQAHLMGEFDARHVHAADGSKTAAAWMARATHCAPSEARASTRLARRLPDMSFTRGALQAGETSERHAQILGRLYASPRPVRSPASSAYRSA